MDQRYLRRCCQHHLLTATLNQRSCLALVVFLQLQQKHDPTAVLQDAPPPLTGTCCPSNCCWSMEYPHPHVLHTWTCSSATLQDISASVCCPHQNLLPFTIAAAWSTHPTPTTHTHTHTHTHTTARLTWACRSATLQDASPLGLLAAPLTRTCCPFTIATSWSTPPPQLHTHQSPSHLGLQLCKTPPLLSAPLTRTCCPLTIAAA